MLILADVGSPIHAPEHEVFLGYGVEILDFCFSDAGFCAKVYSSRPRIEGFEVTRYAELTTSESHLGMPESETILLARSSSAPCAILR